ncbi:MAG: tetratricopeptide repeat protein [Candidatus Eisenbacteria bacterium]
MGAFFAPDDLISLERARGLVAPYPVPFWRVLSGSGYFALALRGFGTDPFRYHLFNLLVHALNVTLVFLLARRWSRRTLVATLAAGLFSVSRLYSTALLQAVGIEELLALAFTLLALLAFDATRPRRVLAACGLFAAALLSKESVLLVPLILLLPLAPVAPWRRRVAGVAALLAVSAVYLIVFFAWRGSMTVSGGEAYATRYGVNLLHNLMTYVSWMGNLGDATPDLTGRVSDTAWRHAIWIVAGLVTLAAAAWRDPVLVVAGFAWFVLALVPVLAYLHHSYLHYLYPALPGMTLAIGRSCDALFDWAGARWRAPVARRVGWALAAVLILTHAGLTERVNERRWSAMTPGTELPVDPVLRKGELARHVVDTIDPSIQGRHARLVFLTPPEASTLVDITTGRSIAEPGSGIPNLLISVLDEGRGLRALRPQLDSVAFVPRWSMAYRDFDLVATTVDGFAVNFGQGPVAHLELARALFDSGNAKLAVDDLDAAIPAYPGDPRLAYTRARIVAVAGGSGSGAIRR